MKDVTIGLCPPEKPVFSKDTLACEPCPENSTFHKDIKYCVTDCEAGFELDGNYECKSKCDPTAEVFNKTLGKCVARCNGSEIYNQVIGECQSPEEFYRCKRNEKYDSES